MHDHFLEHGAHCQDVQTQGQPDASELQQEAGVKVLACTLLNAHICTFLVKLGHVGAMLGQGGGLLARVKFKWQGAL